MQQQQWDDIVSFMRDQSINVDRFAEIGFGIDEFRKMHEFESAPFTVDGSDNPDVIV